MRGSLGPLTLLSTLVLFVLPFVEFSCQGKSVMTLSGYDTAFGREVKAELPIGKWLEEQEGRRGRDRDREGGFNLTIQNKERTEPNKTVAAALICAVLGGVAAFVFRLAGVAGGAGAVVLLLYAQNQMQKDMQQAPPLVAMTFEYGFWLSLIAAAVGAVLCLTSGKK
ncbi:hypothetical protein DES53_10298 [Roseimicrobium gellanilyticum]|uniref:Uncharacterized protein n=1 Tax=Roseimicrobium gellanilyticum TaxID=748857 RepID=A0A366HQF1_9BACT|nr:hypothetical protein [Roseimicrobium gellanilyticum]RBP45716.1 hypothetical protein DES53_10298 [Roseimicrobium gellanilyticum]